MRTIALFCLLLPYCSSAPSGDSGGASLETASEDTNDVMKNEATFASDDEMEGQSEAIPVSQSDDGSGRDESGEALDDTIESDNDEIVEDKGRDALDEPIVKENDEIPPSNGEDTAQDDNEKNIDKRDKTCGVDSQFDEDQTNLALNAHNAYRTDEQATNEIRMTWDDNMARLSQAWGDKCLWKHGMLRDCDNKAVGQNMFISSGGKAFPKVNVTNVVRAWASEKKFYHLDTKTCDQGKMCGHYTQVVWSKTEKVGCGISRCDKVKVGGKTWTNAVIVVCDYTPPGNYRGQVPFLTGDVCSACPQVVGGKSGWTCDDNLCRPCTPDSDPNCQCSNSQDKCENGGTFNTGLCTCDCPKQFYGPFCQNKCECTDMKVRACPYWKKLGFCDNKRYRGYMSKHCAMSCNTCVLPESCSAQN